MHASALIDEAGKVIATREDVGRHNALDKLLGHSIQNGLLDPKVQFIACSGRLNFELVQKGLMANIGIMAGVGAPTSLAVDLAKRFDMSKRLAKSTARLVGAPTPAIIPIFAINPF